MEKKTIIIWDFSWIQNYLFDIKKNKSATKRLRWRSVFIEMLLEKIMQDLKNYKEKIADFEERDYLISWWKFILIWENFNIEKFKKFKAETEKKLFKEFYGELKIIFWISEWNWEKWNFKKALNKAYENVEKNKLRAFESILIDSETSSEWQFWNDEIFIFNNNRLPQSVCKFSRWDLIKIKKDDKNIDWYIKDILEEENIDWMWLHTANDIIISNFVADNKWTKNEIKIFDEKIKIDEKYKKELPKNNDWKIKSFEDLAWNTKFNKLAVLKWDIDNLWEIFQFGLKDSETSSEWQNYQKNYKELSEILENFWKEKLYNFIENNDKYKNKLYVVYAGWDDFVILGKWDIIIKFYADLLKDFEEKISKNKKVINLLDEKKLIEDSEINSEWQKEKIADIHFSWAINLFWAHDTFFTVVKNTEELLEKAKEWNKNKVNIFGQVLKNEEFKQILEEVEKFIKEFKTLEKEKSIVSVWTLRFLLDVWKKIKLEKNDWKDENWNQKDFFEYGTWRSELFYHLGRNYNRDNKKEFRNYIDWMLLWNEVKEFKNLSWKNNLFENDVGEKLIVMMSYLLYKIRDK